MSNVYTGLEGYSQRKGVVVLTRLAKSIPYESTIEERLLRVLDMDLRVKNVERAESVKVFAVDGSHHTYTSDFHVELINDTIYSLECKPAALLASILSDDEAKWHARANLLQQKNILFNIVTNRDLPESIIQWALTYAPFYRVPTNPEVEKQVFYTLSERGCMLLSSLRAHIHDLTKKSYPEIDGTIKRMVARQKLVVDTASQVSDCLIDLPNQSILLPELPIGKPVFQLLADLPQLLAQPRAVPILSPEQKLENDFLQSKRGETALRLFALYSNPTAILSNNKASQIAKELGISARTVFRFRQSLENADAPGITFTDLVPYLVKGGYQKPKRQVDLAVATIIERLANEAYFRAVGTSARARSMQDLHEMVRKECLEKDLPQPAYNTVKRHIERISDRDPVRASKLRQGNDAAAKLESRQGFLDIRRYGEVIGIDCTPCDVFFNTSGVEVSLKTEQRGVAQRRKGAIRGNFVTVADVATTQVLRSVIFEGAISGTKILEVLRAVFLGDTKLFSATKVLTVPQATGLPQRIRMDSGSEFLNKQVGRVLAHLGIERLPRNASTKHFGGVEERTIGTLSHAQHILVGTTTNTIENRGDYDSQARAVLSFTDLNNYHQRIVERHNNLPAPLQTLTRQQHAQRLIDDGITAWRSLTESQLEFVQNRMHPEETRKALTEGISMFGLKYRSDKLRPFIIRKSELKITYNPDDISVITALNPETGELIPLNPRLPQGIYAPLSLKSWETYNKRVREVRRQALDGVSTPQQIARGVMAERDVALEAERKSRAKIVKKANAVYIPDVLDTTTSTIQAATIVFEDNPVSRND